MLDVGHGGLRGVQAQKQTQLSKPLHAVNNPAVSLTCVVAKIVDTSRLARDAASIDCRNAKASLRNQNSEDSEASTAHVAHLPAIT